MDSQGPILLNSQLRTILTSKDEYKSSVLEAISEALELLDDRITISDCKENILQYVMPSMQNLFSRVYHYNSSIEDLEEEFQVLNENLEIAISLCDKLGYILKYLDENLENLEVCDIILHIPECIFLTFEHCKNNQRLYESIVEKCENIMKLFNVNQNNHNVFLNLVVRFNYEPKVLEKLTRINSVLFGMNLNCLAKTWKAFFMLMEKHIFDDNYFCEEEIRMIMFQVSGLLDTALKNEDNKSVVPNIKLSCFLLKIAFKIFDTFWHYYCETKFEILTEFFETMYIYDIEYIDASTPYEVIGMIEQNFIATVDNFLDTNIFSRREFFENFLVQTGNPEKPMGWLKFSNKVLESLPDGLNSGKSNIGFEFYLKKLFKQVQLGSQSFFYATAPDAKCLFYELINSVVASLNKNNFYTQEIENILIDNILGENEWCIFLAMQIWIEFLSMNSLTNAVFHDLISDINNTSFNASYGLLFETPQIINLKTLLKHLFRGLTMDEKNSFIKKYMPNNCPDLWKFLTMQYFPKNCSFLIESQLALMISQIDSLDSRSLDFDEFVNLVELMKLFSCYNNDDIGPVLAPELQKLWSLHLMYLPNNENYFLIYYITNLVKITLNFMKYMPNADILMVLHQLKSLLQQGLFKTHSSELLKLIKSYNFDGNQNLLLTNVADILRILQSDENNVVVEMALQNYNLFKQTSGQSFEAIEQNLRQVIKDPSNEVVPSDFGHYLNSNKPFRHVCPQVKIGQNTIPTTSNNHNYQQTRAVDFVDRPPMAIKKIKLSAPSSSYNNGLPINLPTAQNTQDDDNSIGEIIARLKSEIKCLNKTLSKEKMTPKNAQDLKMAVCQLQNLL